MSARQFLLPDLGEGLTEAAITTWAVSAGEVVTLNQVIVEVETAKALVEIPSPFAGVVEELLAAEGETVDVGTPIIRFAADPDDASPAPPAEPAPTEVAAAEEEPEASSPRRQNVLVGYGPGADAEPGRAGRRRSRASESTHRAASAASPAAAGLAEIAAGPAMAKPPVRRLAKTLGVDLRAIRPTGRNGAVTRGDVERAAMSTIDSPHNSVLRIPVTGVRRLTAEAVSTSALTVPHVTEFITVDVTRTMKLVRKLRAMPSFADLHVSPMLVVARALIVAVQATPILNARYDEHAHEILQYDAVNLGIAAATPRGLLVPNLRGAQALTLHELAGALTGLIGRARAGKTAVEELRDGTITITNIGGFGVDTGTPILNAGEAAILCVGAIRSRPWNHKGRVALRDVVTLSLSFDHRVADGREGSALLRDVADILSDPTQLIARSL